MGTWSTSLFGGDIACDVRENYVAYLKMGLSGRQATKQILEDYGDELSDTVQDGPVVWLALAAIQWKYGRLEPKVKAKALKIINGGGDLAAWTTGQIVAFRRDSGRIVLMLTEGVTVHDYMGQIPQFVLLKWEGMKIPSPEKIRKLRIIEYLLGVMPNHKDSSIPWERIQRLNVKRSPSGIASIDADGVFCEKGSDECHWNELDSAIDDAYESNG
jgi:hypothetical protein